MKGTTSSGDCPDEGELLTLIAGRSSGAPASLLEHVDGCAACRIAIGELAGGGAGVALGGADPRTVADGERLLERYRIVRFVARGGMGEVYEAEDELLGDTVALKTLTCTTLDQRSELRRLKAEVLTARRVTHTNVCRILEFGVHRRATGSAEELIPFLTMEFLRGETLRARLRRAGAFAPDEVARLLPQMLDALAAIHGAGIVHRDWKSDNLFLIEEAPRGTRIVAMDFGLARAATGAGLTMSSGGPYVVGTPDYMAPEQLLGEPATMASDVYSFGVVLFEMLTGALPFDGRTPTGAPARRIVERARPPSSVRSDLPPAWDRLVGRCLERDPERRPQSSQQLRALAAALLRGVRRRRGRSMAVVLAAALGVTAAITLIASPLVRRPAARRAEPAPAPRAAVEPPAAIPAAPSSQPTPEAAAPAPVTPRLRRNVVRHRVPSPAPASPPPSVPASPRPGGRDGLLDPWRQP